MKVGVIVHSYSGNTLSVAEKIKESLLKVGHSIDIVRIQIIGGENPGNRQFEIENPPEVNNYDALIFGAPVRGFSISPVIAAYLNQLHSLKDKKAACFVTKKLSSDWTGGKKAIALMKDICESKGGIVVGMGTVCWKSKNRENEIDVLTEKLCSLF